ncbi:hypothetical protein ABB37_07092 [Leptomonas pyrrhocoris]|uniref:PX domain-containing protein n=1 Tax=Leptomonas pyrrhocoris TaxID=157538 RepID=A0A0N0DTB2_LEPPY|nr:hypothetical protein ABB37_07092 [Leptomonas pyrrhocoris]KPA77172.1 hypothetical protein ABB37_07092 [Leptomonas pyrrhocoris]|eukprot:XP_015655611.1 hypothetical protein ABB37_07092 [Leptomonas pyrrhocoris]
MLSDNKNPFEAEYQRTASPAAPATPPPHLSPHTTNSPTRDTAATTSTTIHGYDTTMTTIHTGSNAASNDAATVEMLPAGHSVFTPLSSPHAAVASATTLNDSVTIHVQAGHPSRVVLARFRVDPAFKGKEVVRAITYFPITTEILVDNDASFTVPDIPLDAPHLTGIDMGVKRSDWSRGNSATVERRYSEVVDLRELLTYQFPTLILPPLPRKSSVGDIETYFSASDAFAAQRHKLQFFLYEVAAMPEVIFFSEWVAPFFLDPRDTFETGTLLRMRAALRDVRLANRAFHECSRRHRSFTDYTANKIAAKSSSFVRSIAGFFFSSKSSDESSESMLGGGGSSSNMPVPTTSSSGTYDWTYLPPEAKSDACAWVRVCEQLTRRQQAMKESSRCFEKYLASLTQTNDAQLMVAQSFESYEFTLRSTPAFASLGEQHHLAARLIDAVSMKRRDFLERKYVNVCMRLSFESNLIDAVLDAVDTVLGQYQFLSSAQLMNTRDRTQEEALRYTQAVSRALLVDYRDRYKFNYNKRMRNLIREQIARPSYELASAVEQVTRSSDLLREVQDASFTAVDVQGTAGASAA